jgi:hypothetical protein
MEVEELVEGARVALDEDRVPVAVGVRTAFDLHVPRDRIRAGVALLVVVEGDGEGRLRRVDDGDRNPDRPAVPEA